MSFSYRWPRPALTVDVVVFGLHPTDSTLSVLLIRRKLEPFSGWWALPGGFVHVDESLEWAARRELAEEAGVRPRYLEQIGAFGEPGRDPRERVISVAFFALVQPGQHPPAAASDACSADWFTLTDLPALAFDHAAILSAAQTRLRERAEARAVVADLLPPQFTLSELQRVHEAIAGHELDKRNFRKRVQPFLVDTGVARHEGAHRPAQLFSLRRSE